MLLILVTIWNAYADKEGSKEGGSILRIPRFLPVTRFLWTKSKNSLNTIIFILHFLHNFEISELYD